MLPLDVLTIIDHKKAYSTSILSINENNCNITEVFPIDYLSIAFVIEYYPRSSFFSYNYIYSL